MLPSTFAIEIEDASLAWQDVTEDVEELSDGTGSESQVIPTVSVTFAADVEETIGALINPELNRQRPRLRITEDGENFVYYLIEGHSGSVRGSKRYPVLTGRAWAGILDDMRKLSHEFTEDALASTIAAQVAHADFANQGGITVAVIWQASQDPTIPGRRYNVSKKGRREIIKELAEACGAALRVSADGLAIEVYDRPARALSASAVAAIADADSLSYEFERVDEPKNAVRVQGEVLDYTRPALPVISVSVYPSKLEADGDNTAEARAVVVNSSGRRVAHQAIVDEAIAAGSYTDIPVSGCYSVLGVWLNTGTQESPVKGARIEPTGFTASVITVPNNATQLFIVSYTRAEVVSWSLSDYQDQIDGEARSTTGTLAVTTAHPIGRVRGVYRASDANRAGVNFYTGGSATPNTRTITLGISPGSAGTAVVIDYDTYNASPVGASISPSSSLCDADGVAAAVIGAGETVGMAVITASALGQEGSAQLSLTGNAIGGLEVEVNPSVIRAQYAAYTPAEISESHGIEYAAGTGYTIDVDNAVFGIVSLTVGGTTPKGWSWTNGAENRVTIVPPFGTTYVPGTTVAIVYTTRDDVEFTDQSAEITATVTDSDGDPVTDGTAVKFAFVGSSLGASLSSPQAYTSDGEASVIITSGQSTGEVRIRVTAGSFYADVTVKISTDGEEIDAAGADTTDGTEGAPSDTASYPDDGDGCETVPKDSDDDSGAICGRRLVVGCDNNPLARQRVMVNGEWHMTDMNGYLYFCNGVEGSNTVETEGGVSGSFDIAPAGSPSRGTGSWEDCS